MSVCVREREKERRLRVWVVLVGRRTTTDKRENEREMYIERKQESRLTVVLSVREPGSLSRANGASLAVDQF